MKFNVDVISTEMVKPSSPTADNLRHYTFSFLDRLSPPVYNPLLLFYPNDTQTKPNDTTKFNQLKQSLSQVLTYYYPLAGRIKEDDDIVDCNDDGAVFRRADVSGKLSDAVGDPEPSEFNKLLPFRIEEDQIVPLGVQLNTFECGGVCIGLCLSHKIADALSMLTFLKTWAALSRGDTENIVWPEFNSATVFPPMNTAGFNPSIGITDDNIVAKRFTFSHSAIESLREIFATKSKENGDLPLRPSRVEALSVFICSRFMSSGQKETGPAGKKIYVMLQTVNLRPRMNPRLSEQSFGNYFRFVFTFPSEGSDLVKEMRDAVSKIDDNYVKQLKEGNQHLDFIIEKAEHFMSGEMDFLSFTSLCRFPLYEADFGWSKPVWVGSPKFPFNNLVIFMDTATGDGVQALVHLTEEDMAKFQVDPELLKFATC